jgi:hypothetical protein
MLTAAIPPLGPDCIGRRAKPHGEKQWLIGHFAGGTPVPVNLQRQYLSIGNVLTMEHQGDLTTVVMVGGEKVYVDTMLETLIGAVAPAGPV